MLVQVPAQMVALPEMVAVGKGYAVTIALALAVQPLPLQTVTVYVPEVETLMDCVVVAIDHR